MTQATPTPRTIADDYADAVLALAALYCAPVSHADDRGPALDFLMEAHARLDLIAGHPDESAIADALAWADLALKDPDADAVVRTAAITSALRTGLRDAQKRRFGAARKALRDQGVAIFDKRTSS